MINAKELRIGNRVKHNDIISASEFPGTEFQWLLAHWYDIETNRLSLESIDPIPLTPELLKKAGFKRHKCGPSGQDMWAGMDGWSIQGSSDWLFRGSPNCLHLAGYYNTQIRYVHTLQNLFFSLTGEELSISL